MIVPSKHSDNWIPLKIHRVWFGGPIPEEFERYWDAWAKLHPSWELVTWYEEDLRWLRNRREFDDAVLFNTKANVARYEIVYREGGLYVDCDFEPLRAFDELLTGAYLVVGEEREGVLNNALFAATPEHPVLGYAIEELPRSFHALANESSQVRSGPHFWTRCVRRGCAIYGLEPRTLTRDQIYPYGPAPSHAHLRHADFGSAYAVHHWAGARAAESARDKPMIARLRNLLADPPAMRRVVKNRTARLARRGATLIRGGLRPRSRGTYVGNNRVLVCRSSGSPMLAFADDLGVTPTLIADGIYDPAFVKFLARELQHGDVAVDVGANIGLFTIAMAQAVGHDGRVFAFEPNPETFDVLLSNVYLSRMRGLPSEVHCRPIALGSAYGAKDLTARTRHRGMGTTARETAGEAPGGEKRFGVLVDTLDRELAGVTEVRLVKIDAEGAELDIIRGMRRLFEERRVRLLDLELIDRHNLPAWTELSQELRALVSGYSASTYRINNGGKRVPLDLEAALHTDGLGHFVIEFPSVVQQRG